MLLVESIVAISSFSLVVAVLLLFLELKLTRTVDFVGEELQLSERHLSDYREYKPYLQRRERTAQLRKLNSVSGSVRFLRRYSAFLRKQQRTLVESYATRVEELQEFVKRFVDEYVRREVERSKDFFTSRPFDRDQLEAIVKKDTYSLVLASAGSGKTRTLTARIAYTVRGGADQQTILALAYTRSAEEEMRSRLKSEYGIVDVDVKTFHSLGRQLAQLSPNFRPGVADNQQQPEIIRESFDRLRSDRYFAKLLLDLALEFHADERDETDFASRENYYEYLRHQRHTTLSGISVKSIAERDIANFLFLNQVKCEYEPPANWADRNPRYRTYQPDFFLPEYAIWLEHWAISKNGTVPEWFSSRQAGDPSTRYRLAMQWKREQFRKHRRRLIETYNYQWDEGTLIPELRRQLKENNVQLRELTTEQILDKVQSLIPRRDVLNELVFSFISKAKTNGMTIEYVVARLKDGNWSRRQRVYASLMIRVWQEYESILEQRNMIDFNDMINYALGVAQSSKRALVAPYSHILIDEFQDITNPQLDLIKCLLNAREGSTLFCVGDDMQNIFSFAGSNIYNIVEFDKRFTNAEQTVLSTNYRCPKNIVEASNFVANLNKVRVDKKIVPALKVTQPMCLIEMQSNDGRMYEEWQHEKAKTVLTYLIRHKKPDEETMVLSRFNRPLKRLELEFPQSGELGLRFLSIHRAKGTEADNVLLLGCVSGRDGFPSEMIDSRVLDIVQKSRGDKLEKLEEERRLFYVALTRCKNQLYIFTSSTQGSRFISEVRGYLTPWSNVEHTFA